MAENYALYDHHIKFMKRFTATHPPCFQCGNGGNYLCHTATCTSKPPRHSHACTCIQSGYPINQENAWYKRCIAAQEPYTFGGWKLMNPHMAPGTKPFMGRPVSIDDLLEDPAYEKHFAGLDDAQMLERMDELIHGNPDERRELERQSGSSAAKREKLWHLVSDIPWCDEHDRPLHLREGEGEWGAYAFYSCPAPVASGYCAVRVNRKDLK